MIRTRAKEYLTLIKRLAIIGGMIAAVVIVWRACGKPSDGDDFAIDQTPLRVEKIRAIAELNTINFRDEVVVDSVEYYKNIAEQMAGNSEKLRKDFTIDYSNIRRRLTLIVKGELIYGFNLEKKFGVLQNDSLIEIILPQPQLLTVSLSPANTEVFAENGDWQDFERIRLQEKAKRKMITSGERLNLKEKAKAPVENLLRKLIRTNKKLVIRYE